jgi:hypothetical protein
LLLSFTFAYVSIVTMVLVALAALLLKNREYDKGSLWFKTYFIVAAITDIVLFILMQTKTNSMPVANSFSVAQFFLLSTGIVFWVNRPGLRKVLQFATCLIALVLAIYVLGTLHKKVFDSFSITIENVLLMILSAVILIQLTGDSSQFLFKNHKFWFAVAVFLYFSVSAIVFATANFLIGDQIYLRRYTWIINVIMSILANILYLKGILCLPLKKN